VIKNPQAHNLFPCISNKHPNAQKAVIKKHAGWF